MKNSQLGFKPENYDAEFKTAYGLYADRLSEELVLGICLFDPDGDIVRNLRVGKKADVNQSTIQLSNDVCYKYTASKYNRR